MVQTLETFKDIDKATIASTVGPPATSNHQEADHNQPKADDGFAKTSKWLDDHDVDSHNLFIKTYSVKSNQIPAQNRLS